jgi:hypothetical protein
MALSKQEQDVLNEIEKGLREDAAFRTGLDPQRVRRRGRLLTIGLLVTGLLLLVAGEILALASVPPGVIVAVGGFLVMLAAFAPSVRRIRMRVRPGRSPTVSPGGHAE